MEAQGTVGVASHEFLDPDAGTIRSLRGLVAGQWQDELAAIAGDSDIRRDGGLLGTGALACLPLGKPWSDLHGDNRSDDSDLSRAATTV